MAYLSKVRCAQINALAPAPRLPPRAGPSGAVPLEQTLQLSRVSEPSTSLQLPCPHPLHSGSPSSSAYEPAPPNVVQNDVLYRSVFNRFVEPVPREEPMRAPAGHGSHPVLPFSGCCDPGLHASQAGQPSFLATAGDNARAAAWFRQHTRYAMGGIFSKRRARRTRRTCPACTARNQCCCRCWCNPRGISHKTVRPRRTCAIFCAIVKTVSSPRPGAHRPVLDGALLT